MTMTPKRRGRPPRAAEPATPRKIAPVPDHYFEGIQGWFNFAGPYREAVARGKDGAQFVEVGCWKGRSTAFLGVEILRSAKKITLHCVDHFMGSDEEVHRMDVDLPDLFKLFSRNMQPCTDAGLDLEVHTLQSADAASQFKDRSCDFVWLDAGHDYASVRADIEAWLPKVRPGGFIGGDDWPMKGVADAVRDCLGREILLRDENGWTTWMKQV